MTRTIEDSIRGTVTIDENGDDYTFGISEAKVEISRNTEPNYARLVKIVPRPNTRSRIENTSELLGKPATVSVETRLERINQREQSNRGTQSLDEKINFSSEPEQKTLFDGFVANLSTLGNGAYEGIVYDPAQQALNAGQEGGSILDQKVTVPNRLQEYENFLDQKLYNQKRGGVNYPEELFERSAKSVIESALEQVEISEENYNIDLKADRKRAQERTLFFKTPALTLRELLEKVGRATNSFWWFDKDGNFNFGEPDPSVYDVTQIVETSAGLKSPPFQSVRVVGADTVGEDGRGKSQLKPDDTIVQEANIVLEDAGTFNAQFVASSSTDEELGSGVSIDDVSLNKFREDLQTELLEPTFEYQNYEIITERGARNAVENLVEKLGEQYASGKVTVAGFPDVQLFDIIYMPHADEEQKNIGNYSKRQPLGGTIFTTYKAVHKINNSDGFVTDIHVAGLSTVSSSLKQLRESPQTSGSANTSQTSDSTSTDEVAGVGLPDRNLGGL